MEQFFVTSGVLGNVINKLAEDYSVYVTVKDPSGELRFKKFPLTVKQEITHTIVRQVEPLKAFLFPVSERVAKYPDKFQERHMRPVVIFGVKACDLHSLKIQDFVFAQGDVQDPFYMQKRENIILVSGDCTKPKETCFCPVYDLKAYPEEGFDINISELEEGFILAVGSKKGQDLLKGFSSDLRPPTSEQLQRIKRDRQRVLDNLISKLKTDNLYQIKDRLGELVTKGYGTSPVWADEAKRCVECGACNFICCTCHCFLLTDSKTNKEFHKYRNWDSCQYAGFARVAGGATPRPKLAHRIRNRFVKKFEFFPAVLGIYACDGCGRCIEACPANIDIREVLKNLNK